MNREELTFQKNYTTSTPYTGKNLEIQVGMDSIVLNKEETTLGKTEDTISK